MLIKKTNKINRIFIILPQLVQVIFWPIARLILRFFLDLNVFGLENLNNIPQDKGIIFASNHSSEIDPLIIPSCFPFNSRFVPIFYMIRERSFYNQSGFRQIFYGGLFFKVIGGQYVFAGLRDYDKSLINHIELLRIHKNVFVFPEGGISRIGKPIEPKGGVAYLAERTRSLVVPIGISGLYGMSFYDFIVRRRKVVVTFGTPISQEEIKSMVFRTKNNDISVYKEEAEYIMKKICHMVQ